jgi:hypothetical protein
MSRYKYFYEGPKKSLKYFFCADGFHNFWQSICEEQPSKVSACFYEITSCENSSSNPLQEAYSGFLKAACVPESCSAAMNVHWRKSTHENQTREAGTEILFGFRNNL